MQLVVFPVISGGNVKVNDNYLPQMAEEDCGLFMLPYLGDDSSDFS